MRLNAFLASCGAASRRKSEVMILEGRVQVNNKIVLAPFFDVDIDNDVVKLDNKIIKPQEHVYYVINKPVGYVCASTDKYDPVILDLIPEHDKRLYPIGRLDRESEGLIIITNDGNFTQSIMHPSNEIQKEYEALLNVEINSKQLEHWRNGFELEYESVETVSTGRIRKTVQKTEKKFVKPVSVEVIGREPKNRWISVTIVDGLKREIRLMARHEGFRIEKLIRRKIGNMKLENLRSGEFVSLSFSELYTKIFNGGLV